jgi:CheY-like chemotaxis protein
MMRPQRSKGEVFSETSSPLTVLVVEDNETDAFVMQEILRECGLPFQVYLAIDGDLALSFLGITQGLEPPICQGLILLDLNVPRVHGLEVLARIRADDRYRDLPVIVVTSSDSPRDRAAVEALNGNAYFCKPSDLRGFMELEHVIRRVLRAEAKR